LAVEEAVVDLVTVEEAVDMEVDVGAEAVEVDLEAAEVEAVDAITVTKRVILPVNVPKVALLAADHERDPGPDHDHLIKWLRWKQWRRL
jgi:hypothetical protein